MVCNGSFVTRKLSATVRYRPLPVRYHDFGGNCMYFNNPLAVRNCPLPRKRNTAALLKLYRFQNDATMKQNMDDEPPSPRKLLAQGGNPSIAARRRVKRSLELS